MPRLKVIKKGQRFGRLIYLGKSKKFKIGNEFIKKEKCLCDCGNIVFVKKYYLLSGHTKSCGCLRKDVFTKTATKHGDKNTRFYGIRSNLKKRGTGKVYGEIPKKTYTLRGINICKEWLDYNNFKKDMYDEYIDHVNKYGELQTTIDRIDNNKGYYKENCRWATYSEQNLNKRSNIKYNINGIELTLKEICDLGLCKVDYNLAKSRRSHGWDIDKIINTPINADKHYLEIDGKKLSIREICDLGLSVVDYGTIISRIKTGWSDPMQIINTPLLKNGYHNYFIDKK